MRSQERSRQVAETIIKQLGGTRFLAMTGAKNFTHGFDRESNPYVVFHVGRFPGVKIKLVAVALTPRDDYTMRFFAKDSKLVEVRETIYCDMLQSTFLEVTGLDTHL